MKRTLLALALPLLLSAGSAFAGGGINIGLDISGMVAPGVYGNVVIGNGRPDLVYEQPVIVYRGPGRVINEPLYLHVPPEHARHWGRYCGQYHACERRVYFVRSNEYRNFRDDRRDHREEWREEYDHGHHDQGRDHDNRDHGHDDHDHGHGHQ